MQHAQLTVLFATRNGAHVLARTLEGYCRAEPPPVAWKLVVVDNGSSDGSTTIINSFRDRLPIELIEQPLPGKSRALNQESRLRKGNW
jgi:glycosyltransferase involved in cell wall biosynthesis